MAGQPEQKLGISMLTPEQVDQLGPEKIIINNVRTIVASDMADTIKCIKSSLGYIMTVFKKLEDEKSDFRKDIKVLMALHIQIATLSIAMEYWIGELKKHKIKVYGADQMPKESK